MPVKAFCLLLLNQHTTSRKQPHRYFT